MADSKKAPKAKKGKAAKNVVETVDAFADADEDEEEWGGVSDAEVKAGNEVEADNETEADNEAETKPKADKKKKKEKKKEKKKKEKKPKPEKVKKEDKKPQIGNPFDKLLETEPESDDEDGNRTSVSPPPSTALITHS